MTLLSQRLFKLAAQSASDYLIQLNLKDLSKTSKRGPNEDPRSFYEGLREEAKKGKLFSEATIQAIHHLTLDLQKQEAQWVGTLLEQAHKAGKTLRMDANSLRPVMDFIRQQTPDLSTLTWSAAQRASEEWHRTLADKQGESTGEYETKNVVFDYGNGYTMVEVPAQDLDTEGDYMGHCVGGDDYEKMVKSGECTIYSLRDKENRPRVTTEVSNDGTVVQVQGRGNKKPADKYHAMLHQFFHKNNLHRDHTTHPFMKHGPLLQAMAEGDDERDWLVLLKSPALTPELLHTLARNPKLAEQLKQGNGDAFDDSLSVAKKLLQRKDLAVEDVVYFATLPVQVDAKETLHSAVVFNHKLPTNTLLDLLKKNSSMKLRALSNPNYPTKELYAAFDKEYALLDKSAKVTDALVMIARNPALKPLMLDDLVAYADFSDELCESLAANHALTAPMLEKLLKDAQHLSDESYEDIVQNPHLDVGVVTSLSDRMSGYSIRYNTTRTLGKDILEHKLSDDDLEIIVDLDGVLGEMVADLLARKETLPSGALLKAVIQRGRVEFNNSPDDAVIMANLAQNPTLPSETCERLLKEYLKEFEGGDGIDSEGGNLLHLISSLVDNPNTPVERVETLSTHAEPRVRSAVANSSKVSKETLAELTKDHYSSVVLPALQNRRTPLAALQAVVDSGRKPTKHHDLVAAAKKEIAKRERAARLRR